MPTIVTTTAGNYRKDRLDNEAQPIAATLVRTIYIEEDGLIQMGEGTKDVDLDGIAIDEDEIVGQNNGVDQFMLRASDGKAMAGGGAVLIDEDGLTITEQFVAFTYNDGESTPHNLAQIGFGRVVNSLTEDEHGKVYLETYEDTVPTEYLSNYGFETDTTGWTTNWDGGIPTISRSSDYAYAGSYSMKYVWTDTGGSTSWATVKNEITSGFSAGELAIFHGHYRITNVVGMDDHISITIGFYNVSSTLLHEWTSFRPIAVSDGWVFTKSPAIYIPVGTTKITVKMKTGGAAVDDTITLYMDEWHLQEHLGAGIWIGEGLYNRELHISRDLIVANSINARSIQASSEISVMGRISDQQDFVATTTELKYHGDLVAMRGSHPYDDYTGHIFVPITAEHLYDNQGTPELWDFANTVTAATFDFDANGNGNDWPANAKALLVMFGCQWASASNSNTLSIRKEGSSVNEAQIRAVAADTLITEQAMVQCDSSGDFEVVLAGNATNCGMRLLGYYI